MMAARFSCLYCSHVGHEEAVASLFSLPLLFMNSLGNYAVHMPYLMC